MNAVILIPARYGSSRYPGKPLVDSEGASGSAKPLIQRSVEAARRVAGVSGVFVTTDDERIADACARCACRRDHDLAAIAATAPSAAPRRCRSCTTPTW